MKTNLILAAYAIGAAALLRLTPVAAIIQTPASPATATVEGSVTALGQPIREVQVVFTPEGYSPSPREIVLNRGFAPISPNARAAFTDDHGTFKLEGVPSGRYTMSLLREGFTRARRSGPTTLTLASGEQLRSVRFDLERLGVITGRVLDTAGRPGNGIVVSASEIRYIDGRRTMKPVKGVRANELGEFRIFDLVPGEYFLSTLSRTVGFPEYHPGVIDPSDAVPIRVAAGTEVGGLEIRKKPRSLYRARVRLALQSSLELDLANRRNNHIVAIRRNRSLAGEAIGDAVSLPDGAYEISDLPPGSYDIVYSSFLFAQTWSVPVEIVDHDVDAGVLNVDAGPPLQGQIRNLQVLPAGFDVSQLSVSFRRIDDSVPPGTLGATNQPFPVAKDGAISQFRPRGAMQDMFLLVRGQYEVRILGLPPDVYLATSGTLNYGPETGKLELALGGPGGVAEGIVRNAKGDPVPEAKVVLIPAPALRQSLGLFSTQTTDQFGRIAIRGIAPGDYSVLAWDEVPANAWLNEDFLREFETRASKIKISAGSNAILEIPCVDSSPGGIR